MLACWARDRANSEIFYSCHGDVELQMFSPFGIFKLQATGTPLRSLALRRLVRAESHGRRLSYRKPAPVKAVSEAWTEPEPRNTLNRLDGKIVALSVDRGRGRDRPMGLLSAGASPAAATRTVHRPWPSWHTDNVNNEH